MSFAPIEKNERSKDADLHMSDAAKATPEQSVTALQKMLQTKSDRMHSFELPKNPKPRDQFYVEKENINQRLEFVRSLA